MHQIHTRMHPKVQNEQTNIITQIQDIAQNETGHGSRLQSKCNEPILAGEDYYHFFGLSLRLTEYLGSTH